MTGPGRFSPVEPGPPRLVFHGTIDYWEQFDVDSVHRFEPIHGPLRSWQLVHKELDAKFRAFYEAQKPKK